MGGCCCCGSNAPPTQENAPTANTGGKGAFADFLESEKGNGGHNPRRSQLGGASGVPQKGYQPLAVQSKRESDVSSAEPATADSAIELRSHQPSTTTDSTGAAHTSAESEITSDSTGLSANNLSVEVVVTSDTHTDITVADSRTERKNKSADDDSGQKTGTSRQSRVHSTEPPGFRRARTFDADSPGQSPKPSQIDKQQKPRSSLRMTDKGPSKKPRASMVVIDASDWQSKATAKNLLKYQKFLKKKQKHAAKKRYQYADADSFFATATAEAEAKMTSAERQKLNQSRNMDSTLESLHSEQAMKQAPKKKAIRKRLKKSADDFEDEEWSEPEDEDTEEEEEEEEEDEDEEEEDSEDEEEEEQSSSSSTTEEEEDSSEERWYAEWKAKRLQKKAAKERAEREAKEARKKVGSSHSTLGSSRTLLTVTGPAEEVKSESDLEASPAASVTRGSNGNTTQTEDESAEDAEKARTRRKIEEVRQLKKRVKERRASKSPRYSSGAGSGDFFGSGGIGSVSSLLSEEERKELRDERRRQRKIREDDMAARMKLYKIEHKKRLREQQRLERKRLMESVPPKPDLNEHEFKEKTEKTLLYISQKFDVGTTFTGMCDFVEKGELPLELHITSQVDLKGNGSFTGESVDYTQWDGSSKKIQGTGLLKCDLVWSATKEKYEECVIFKWTQESDGVVYEMEFNTFDFECDLKHLYFEGICVRYPLLVSKKDNPEEWARIAHCGTFDFVCASRRNHHSTGTSGSSRIIHLREIIGRKAYDEMIDREMMADSDPKWMRRASAYQESIERTKSAARSSFIPVPGTPTAGQVSSITSRADSVGRKRSGSAAAAAARSSLTPSPIPAILPDDASSKLFGKRWSIQPGAQADTAILEKLRSEIGSEAGTLRDLDPLLTQFATTPSRDAGDSDRE